VKPLLLTLLGLSLAANAALSLSRTNAPAAARTGSANTSRPVSQESPQSRAPRSPATPQTGYARFWETLRAGDPDAVARLRAAGWPENAIRALVVAQIDDVYRPRRKALYPRENWSEYWKLGPFAGIWNAERAKAHRDLNREHQAVLKKLLGADYIPEPNRWDERRFGKLSPAQFAGLWMITDDYQALMIEASGGSEKISLPEDKEKIAYLERELQADLARLLSPDELFNYELRTSAIASNLRTRLAAFSPSEEEFRQIFALAKATTQRLGASNVTSAAQTEIDAELKKRLSEERWEDYARAKNGEYRQLHLLAERLQLPTANAVAAFNVQTDIRKRARDLKPPSGATPAEARQALDTAKAALAREAEERLVQALGRRGYDAYRSRPNHWLRSLEPAPVGK
jgi:hypothetical protein